MDDSAIPPRPSPPSSPHHRPPKSNWNPGWMIHKRPTWNTAFGAAIAVLRHTAQILPRDVNAIRFVTDNSIPSWLPTLPQNVKIVKNEVPKGTWYLPTTTGPGDHLQAYILYIHGGAFCLCKPGSHTGVIMRLAESTGARIFAPKYRRPPEHSYPEPVDDCLAAYTHMLHVLQVDPRRLFFAGDSAGGGLAVQTMAAAQRQGLPTPAGAILLSPWVDLSDETRSDSWERNVKYDYLPPDLAHMFANMYRGNYTWEEVGATHLSPAELAALPPLLIELGECEVLHDQIIKFAAKCIAQNVDVELHDREDMVHVFQMFSAAGMAQCDESYRAMGAFCRRILGDDGTDADAPAGGHLPPAAVPTTRGASTPPPPRTAAEAVSHMFHSFF